MVPFARLSRLHDFIMETQLELRGVLDQLLQLVVESRDNFQPAKIDKFPALVFLEFFYNVIDKIQVWVRFDFRGDQFQVGVKYPLHFRPG